MTSYFHLYFLSLESVERKGKKYKNLNISRTKTASSMKQKTFEKKGRKTYKPNSPQLIRHDKKSLSEHLFLDSEP